MKKGTLIAIALHLALAGIVFGHVLTEPTKPLPPEDTLIAKADFTAQEAQIQIWKVRADLLISGKPYTLTGDAITDQWGGVTLLESPTGNAVTILPDGSADVQIGGTVYRFEPEY